MTCLTAARIVTGDGGVSASPAWVVVEDGRIVASGSGAAPQPAEDLGDALLAPGFVDLQVNGTGTLDFATASIDELRAAIDSLVAGGCTSLLPTLCSAPLDTYLPALQRIADLRATCDAVLGVHLEGPFLGGAPGAHPTDLVRPVDLPWLVGLLDATGDLIRLVTLAPEADPGFAATRALTQRGIAVALGHSIAGYDEARAGADAGARMVTHCFNGMGPLHHRAPGLPGAALDDRRLVPSVICDLVHVHPAVLRMVTTVRPDAVAVTDAVGGDLVVGDGGAAYLADGTLAGARVTMAEVVQNLAGIGLAPGAAVRMATGNGAKAIGATDRGRIAPGCRADFVTLDPDTLAVREVWVGGTRRM
ncbi:MAG TPA: amidohydrolase family protein [Acidimicrobiia bacterium]|nr:amidohydrolase family protein [Acidimicrobiia bacterium]